MADSPVRRSTRVRRPTLRTTAEEDGEEESRQRRSSRGSRADEEEDEAAEDEAGEEDEDEELEEAEGDEEEEKEEIKEEEEEEEEEEVEEEEEGEEEEEEEEDSEGQKRGGKEEKEPAQEEVPIDESLFKASKWASLKGMLLNRTLYLHSLSPLHIPPPLRQHRGGGGTGPQAAANSVLTTQQLDIIGKELSSYLSIRLNDSLLIAPASEEGPSRRAEGIGADRLKSVQAGFLSLEEGEPLQRYLSAVRQADEDDDAENEREQGQRRMAWAIEIQIKAAPVFLPSGRMRDRRVELAHLVFLPGARKNHYPLVLSKAPSASALTSTSADDIDGATAAAASSLTARALIAHAFDYMSKRFDCRLTSSTALSSLRGPNMVRLAEAILSSTYAQIQRRRDDLDEEDRPSPPVELTFALPNQVLVDEASNKRKRGPNPRLATLSLTVPWRICRQLLVQEEANGEAVTQRKRLLLPALARYVEEHTSISTDQLSLVRMSIAAVSIGSPLSGGGLTTIAMAAGAGAGGETEAVATEMSSNTFSEPTRTTGSGAPSLGVRLKIAPLKLPDVASSFAADDDRPGVSIKDVDSWRIQDVLTELLDAAVRESW